MKKFLREFKAFAMKGNVIDLAVGVIIGAAFGKIVSSIVGDVVMPLIGIILGGIDFTSLAITVDKAKITYGNFLQAVVEFVVIAFSVFLFVKLLSAFHHKPKEDAKPAEPPKKTDEVLLLEEIRDILRNR